jgi:hypothetical protein
MCAAYDCCWLGRLAESSRESGFSLVCLGRSVTRPARRPILAEEPTATALEPVARDGRVVRRVLWITVPEVILHRAQVGALVGQAVAAGRLVPPVTPSSFWTPADPLGNGFEAPPLRRR